MPGIFLNWALWVRASEVLFLLRLLPPTPLRKILNVFTEDGEIRVKEDNLREVLRWGTVTPRTHFWHEGNEGMEKDMETPVVLGFV